MSKSITLEYEEGVPFNRVVKDIAALASNRNYSVILQSIDTEIVPSGEDGHPGILRVRVELGGAA